MDHTEHTEAAEVSGVEPETSELESPGFETVDLQEFDPQWSRRNFLRSVAAAGAGLILPASAQAAAKKPAAKPAAKPVAKPAAKAPPKPQEVKVAIIGPGNQGRNLLVQCLRIPGVRFVAVCDVWPYAQDYASGILRKYDQPTNKYADYQEMLEKEKDLDAVIIATPDWMHAPQTRACLEAGLHVYCEKEMSNTIEGAADMVKAQRETKKLLQIGHQRRSNPRYWKGLNLIHKEKVLGRVTHCYGQWNRARKLDLGWPKNREMDKATLEKYGYDTMERFANWRWYRKFSGGPIADLGSHQVDIFGWFLKTNPVAVQAQGGPDYYKNNEWYDNIQTLFEFKTEQGPVRAMYQVLNTTSYGGYYEVFMGDAGSLEISEDVNRGTLFPEPVAPKKEWVDKAKAIEKEGKVGVLLTVGETLQAGGKKGPSGSKLELALDKPPHLLHLENFFDAIRKGTPLSCPPEVGFETAVSVLRANEALATGKKYQFDPKEFHV